jgi:multimeric flavodoxin WrbA
MLSGLLKNFIDRTNPIWPHLKGRPLAGIAVAEEGIGKAIENLQTYAAVCGMPWIGSVTAVTKGRKRLTEDVTIMPLLEKLAMDMVNTLR